MRRFLAPAWLGLHLLALAAVLTCVRLGWWQWSRGEDTGRFQNYAYGVEWGVFAAFAVFMWIKAVVDALDPQVDDEPVPAPVVVPERAPVLQDDEEPDEELAAYNAHLARLHEQTRSR